jgi:hypothetical protein
MIKLYFDIYFEFLKNSRFFWKSVYKSAKFHLNLSGEIPRTDPEKVKLRKTE